MGKFGNVQRMVDLGFESWRQAAAHGLAHIRTTDTLGNRLRTESGHEFINMVSCSYLGLNRHPRIIAGAVEALERDGTMSIAVSRARIAPKLVDDVEEQLSDLFGCRAITALSCSVASAGVLPLLASGHFTGGQKPVMVFDKHSHFSMNILKAGCGDETEVVTCEHSDLDFIEDACRRHDQVAYVADGAYSIGGNAPVAELQRLQERYGLFLYFDDSHSLSLFGRRGVGLVRSQYDQLGDRTIVVASLGKAFGATGGLIMAGTRQQQELLTFFGGPLSWSQMLNPAGLGAIRASAEIHVSSELDRLQEKLRANMALLDRQVHTANAGNGLPIRVIDLPDVEYALEAAAEVYRRGYYVSAVFFPIVAQGRAGLRVMGRADLEPADIDDLCDALRSVSEELLVPEH